MTLESFKKEILPLKDKLFRFSLSIVKERMTAEDVVQEVMIKIWSHEDLSQIKNMEAWAMQLTRNLSIDKTRSKHRKTVDVLHVAYNADHSTSQDLHYELRDEVEQVRNLIDELPEKQKQIITLRETEEMEYHEIAETLEISMEDVKVNLFRARQKLKEQISKIKSYGIRTN